MGQTPDDSGKAGDEGDFAGSSNPPRGVEPRGGHDRDELSLTHEFIDTTAAERIHLEAITKQENTRRGILIGLAAGLLLLLGLQVFCALWLSPERWARVGPVLASFCTIAAGGLGAALVYYFPGYRDRHQR